MLVLRSDGTLPPELLDVYRVVPGPLANPRELMVRVSAGATVVPLLFQTDDLPAGRVFATVKGVLAATV